MTSRETPNFSANSSSFALSRTLSSDADRSRSLLRRIVKEHAPDDAERMLGERVVAHLEQSGFEIDEGERVMRPMGRVERQPLAEGLLISNPIMRICG